jgi:quinol monooxygenase YgiN
MMMVSIIKIVPIRGKRNEVMDILVSVKGPTLASSGCLECRVCEERGDEYTIIYLEKWQSVEAFYRQIRSNIYSRVLGAMELSRKRPEVFFLKIAETKGMELIKELRKVQN